jgi:hypothetical protein
MNDISIDIGHVVMHGVIGQSGNTWTLEEHLATALRRLLEQQGLPLGLREQEVARVATPPMSLPQDTSAVQIAEGVALALYQGLSRME